jgi:hypothetical protein
MRRIVISLLPLFVLCACAAPTVMHDAPPAPAGASYTQYDLDTTELTDESVLFFADTTADRDNALHASLMQWYAEETFAHPTYRVDIQELPELALWYDIDGGGVFVKVDQDGNMLSTLEEPSTEALRDFLLQ